MQTEDAILLYNHGLSNWATAIAGVWNDIVKGVVIHQITPEQAAAISVRIKPSAAQYNIPLCFALGCLAIESTLDPNCQNGNLGPGESNTANDPLGYDMGVAQLKLRYLVGVVPGVVDAPTANAFALDVDKAIPYFCSLMAGKIVWAQEVIARNTSSAPDVRLSNSFLLATGAYNFGETGMSAQYASGAWPSHCQEVLDLTRYFQTKLGLPDMFAGLPT